MIGLSGVLVTVFGMFLISAGSNGKAKCSVCGVEISSGSMCSDCKSKTDKLIDDLKDGDDKNGK